ncbi:response regulator [Bremerella sp. T1]|uniref:response regulator n=1 Tax=unclassified Bremerella TaxID=2795601 RepID=UPI001CCCFCC5|nr:response regulator [Bremerella volcania]UBM36355.1 response regulator [Bremerella volcania]
MFPYIHFSFLHHRRMGTTERSVRQPNTLASVPIAILLVEFRDEVFAAIRSEIENPEISVTRANSTEAVVPTWRQRKPGLILINAEMPDESGFLVSLKLRMHGFQGGLWLYSAHAATAARGYQEFCQADRLFCYGGDLRALTTEIKRFLQP